MSELEKHATGTIINLNNSLHNIFKVCMAPWDLRKRLQEDETRKAFAVIKSPRFLDLTYASFWS